MISHDIITQFFQHFRVVPADTIALLREVYRIRYDVYCREMGFERAEDFPDGLESDDFDRRSMHCLLQHRASSTYAGCVRLILRDPQAPEAPFPFEKYCGHSLDRRIIDPASLNRDSFGEISRLTVTSQFRRRAGEQHHPHGKLLSRPALTESERRSLSHVAIGLYLAGAAMGLQQGLNSVFVMMEPRLARHLQLYDIHFTPVGEVVDYHGKRGPFHLSREQLMTQLSPPLASLLAQIQLELAQASGESETVHHANVVHL